MVFELVFENWVLCVISRSETANFKRCWYLNG